MKKQLLIFACLAGLTGCLSTAVPGSSPEQTSDPGVDSTAPVTAVSDAPETAPMRFFITSEGSGKGANLGGLAGADAHCQKLAEAVGSDKTWKAYLSSSSENARDRIGEGPWHNAKGTLIAQNIASLHQADTNFITKANGLNEKGEMVNGRGDTPNRHDILTGSTVEGLLAVDQTCGDWTLEGEDGAAMVGHHDRMGLSDDDASRSWNTSHPSRGCSQENLQGTGGDGLFYCFATN